MLAALLDRLAHHPAVRSTRVARRLRWLVSRARGWPDLKSLRAAGLEMGDRVRIMSGAYLDPDFAWLISIGDDTVLSPDVVVLVHDASTRHHVGFTRIAPVRIGSGVYVGACSVVLPGVTIGEGAIVAAGSVVRHDVEPGTVVGGVPARVIGSVADYTARHIAALEHRPQWPKRGWTIGTGITEENKRLMRQALRDGEGYIR